MIQDVIASPSLERLLAAAESLCTTQKTSDPAIAIQAVAELFCGKMRLHIRALFVEIWSPGLLAHYKNPSDLRDPLVVKLAGLKFPTDSMIPIDFTIDHPEYGQKTQVIRTPDFPSRTVTLLGQLSVVELADERSSLMLTGAQALRSEPSPKPYDGITTES
jgi:hypothetical protein